MQRKGSNSESLRGVAQDFSLTGQMIGIVAESLVTIVAYSLIAILCYKRGSFRELPLRVKLSLIM